MKQVATSTDQCLFQTMQPGKQAATSRHTVTSSCLSRPPPASPLAATAHATYTRAVQRQPQREVQRRAAPRPQTCTTASHMRQAMLLTKRSQPGNAAQRCSALARSHRPGRARADRAPPRAYMRPPRVRPVRLPTSRRIRNIPRPESRSRPDAMMVCSSAFGSLRPRAASTISSARYPPSSACARQKLHPQPSQPSPPWTLVRTPRSLYLLCSGSGMKTGGCLLWPQVRCIRTLKAQRQRQEGLRPAEVGL